MNNAAQPSSFITFVLGAGASNEVKMPTGWELKAKIGSSLSFSQDAARRLSGGDALLWEVLLQLGQERGNKFSGAEYVAAARLISGALPLAPSIDNFIDSHRANECVAECGKLAIALEILRAERSSSLFFDRSRSSNGVDFKALSQTWFGAFFQLVTLNAQFEDLADRFSRIRIISFNYDRTLEHFLLLAIQKYYGRGEEEVASALRSLRVLHPYGVVGSLPWQAQEVGVPYGEELHSSALIQVAAKLRTFTEGTSKSDSQIDAIRAAIRSAVTLVFLGFAYHELNLELLYGAEEPSNRTDTRVYGTAVSISDSNKKAISVDLARLGGYDISNVTLRKELSAAQLIPEYSRSLRIPSAA